MEGNRELGIKGEEIAAQYLLNQGYQVIEKNLRTDFGELDLICLDQSEEVVFVEVKTRESLESGYPEDSVTPAKLSHMAASAECFLADRTWEGKSYRFDVIAIILRDDLEPEILHLQGV